MKTFIHTFVLLFCLIAINTLAMGSTIVVGVSSGYPPYYFKQNGILTGFCIDLVNAVAQEMDLKVIYKEYPWKRLLLSAQKHEVDAVMPLFRTETREKYLYFDKLDLADETNHLFTTTDTSVAFDGSLEKITSFRIGVVSDYSYGQEFDEFTFSKKILTKDDKHLIEMFIHNRFDIGVGNRYVIHYYAAKEGLADKLKFLNPPITKEELYIGFTKKQNAKHIATRFAAMLGEFKTTAEYQKLINKYSMKEQD